jgi:hypothetical protein
MKILSYCRSELPFESDSGLTAFAPKARIKEDSLVSRSALTQTRSFQIALRGSRNHSPLFRYCHAKTS